MRADRVLDIGARYTITKADGAVLGHVKHSGWKSLWQARYGLVDPQGKSIGLIREENPWIAVIDTLLGEIPILGQIAAILINPTYVVEVPEGQTAFQVKKNRSFFERRFVLEERRMLDPAVQTLALAGVMMMVLLERSRG